MQRTSESGITLATGFNHSLASKEYHPHPSRRFQHSFSESADVLKGPKPPPTRIKIPRGPGDRKIKQFSLDQKNIPPRTKFLIVAGNVHSRFEILIVA